MAQDNNLTQRDLRVMLALMSEHDRGYFDKGQEYIAQLVSIDTRDCRKIMSKLEELGYIIRQRDKRGAVISIMISPFIMFQGRRNQQERRMDMTVQEVIHRNRKHYYDKIAKDPNDYPNAGKAVWPGYGKDGGDWEYGQEEAGTEGD